MSNGHSNRSAISADAHVGNILDATVNVGTNCDNSHQGVLVAANVDLDCTGIEASVDTSGGDCGLLSLGVEINFVHDGGHIC